MSRRKLPDSIDLLAAVALWGAVHAPVLTRDALGVLDWTKEVFWLAHVRFSLVVLGRLPGDLPPFPYSSPSFPALAWSHSYWANPEVITSPLVLLVGLCSVTVFARLWFVAHCLVGIGGLIALGRRLGLHPALRVAWVALLFGQPFLIQHYAIGYSPHVTLALTPWAVWLLLDPRRRENTALAAGAVVALIPYHGSLHVYLWTLGTLALWCLARLPKGRAEWPELRRVGLALLSALALAMPKLLAISARYGAMRRSIDPTYRSASDLWGLLTTTRPLESTRWAYHAWYHDGSDFVGPGWVVLFALAVGSSWWTTRKERGATPALLAMAATWVALGWSGVWRHLAEWIPLADCEAYPYRFLALAVMLATAAIVLEAQRTAQRWPRWRMAVAGALFLAALPMALRSREVSYVATQTDERAQLRSLDGYMRECRGMNPTATMGSVPSPAQVRCADFRVGAH